MKGIEMNATLSKCLVEIFVCYDSTGELGFETGWGFSALIQFAGKRILFDCGWDSEILRRNLGRIGITFSNVDAIFLSHGHWDHSTALPCILNDFSMRETVSVYAPKGLSERLIGELSSRTVIYVIDKPTEICPDVWSSGPIGSDGVKEHALIISGSSRPRKGIIITGCAHPGIGRIIEVAKSICDPYIIIGGLHDSKAEEIPLSIDRVIACHCTTDIHRMRARFGDRFTKGYVGLRERIEL